MDNSNPNDSGQPLPALPTFPIYINKKRENGYFKYYGKIVLTPSNLESIQKFTWNLLNFLLHER